MTGAMEYEDACIIKWLIINILVQIILCGLTL